ncbi:MAG: FAD-dependent monooxygenase, partial [Solimonas sp.]
MNILIVGAGIGGLAAAASLLHRGHQVRVHEQAPQLGEVGAGIQMSANAVKVLDELGLRAKFEPTAVRPKAFEFRRFDSGELLHRLPLGEQHEQKHGAPYFQIHRSDLHTALQEAVRALDPKAIVLNARAIRIEEDAAGATVHLMDGSSARGDLVVGADGIKSTVRKHIVGADQPVFTGQVAWRCTVPIERIAPDLRTDIVSTIWCGPKNHAVTYYLRNG